MYGAIAKCNSRNRENCRNVGVFEATGGVECIQMATTTECTSHLNGFLLFNMDGSGPGVGNLEAVVVEVVLVDKVIREVRNSDIKAEKELVSTEHSSMRKLTVGE